MVKDDEKVKNALAKIKSKKKTPEKPAEDKEEVKDEEDQETPAPESQDGEDEGEVINLLQNAGVYRREMLLRANVEIDLLREVGETLKEIKEDQKELINFLKS